MGCFFQKVGGLMTDLYHVDAAYLSWRTGQNGLTTFDLYTRSQPFEGAFLLTAGLELALEFVQGFCYTDRDLTFLQQTKAYEQGFLEELRQLRFTGEILAVPEGTVAFADEPLLRITSTFREALLLESGLLHLVGLSTLIATKAARVVHAARGRPVAEFAFRRAQEPFIVARSAYIGGCAGTSFLAAARTFGIRATGTVPHALIQAFDTEEGGFRAVAESFNNYTLLLDTYNVRRAIHTAVKVAHEARKFCGHNLAAVRLDSGDLLEDSRYVRQVLDTAGLQEVRILASGDLDEFRIDSLLSQGAPIGGFGVGTSIGIGAGSSERGIGGGSLGTVYKLVWYEGEGASNPARMKVAGDKSTWPGLKQIYRIGQFEEDIIQLQDESKPPRSSRLLRPVAQNGLVLPGAMPPLAEIRDRAENDLKALPPCYKDFREPAAYPVRRSESLYSLRKQVFDSYR